MEKLRIGAVTVAQSPRTDIMCDAPRYLGDRVEIMEFGAMDRYSVAEAMRLQPVPGDYILTSRLQNGVEVQVSRSQIADELQRGIHFLEKYGARVILVLCTGDLGSFTSTVPLLEPNRLLRAVVPQLTRRRQILTLTPSREQLEQSEQRWRKAFPEFSFTSFAVSPYSTGQIDEKTVQAIEGEKEADLLIMDCLGFSCQMREQLQQRISKNILLPRSLLFRVTAELLGLT